MPQHYQARLEEKQVFNKKFALYSFELLKPHRLEFQAGQYLSLQIGNSVYRRAYSIVSTPQIDHGVEILVDISKPGLGVNFLESLQYGMIVNFLAPLGRFVQTFSNDEKSVALVGTGSGVAPLRSMILDLLQQKTDQRQITLYWGLRYLTDLIWQDEFSLLAKSFNNFHFHPTISVPSHDWPLCRGRVTDCLRYHHQDEQTGYYLCGSSAMIKEVTSILLNKWLVSQSLIHSERFE